MKRSKMLLIFTVFMSLMSCCSLDKNKEIKDEMKLSYLSGFFSRNDVVLDAETMQIVMSNRTDFDKYFGIAKTMDNTISEINFEENNIAAILTKPSDRRREISIISASVNQRELTVYYKTEATEKQSFTSNDIKIFEIPKTIKTVRFSSDKQTRVIETGNLL